MKQGIKCHGCDETIFSRYRHDFKTCLCGAVFVDGGDDYFRYGGLRSSSFEIVEEPSETA